MKNVVDIEAYADALRTRALAILREFRSNASDPDRIIELADELAVVISEFELHADALAHMQMMSNYLISNKCSGPH